MQIRDGAHSDVHARRAWKIAGFGALGLGGATAALAFAIGLSGTAGAAFFLLSAVLACAVGALYAIATAVADNAKGRPVSRGRAVAAGVLTLASIVLLPAALFGLAG